MQPSRPLQISIRRLPLSPKQAGKHYYRGSRSGSMGRHTKHGGYIIDPKKVRTYVVPRGLDSFKLTPFVTKNIEPPRVYYPKDDAPMSGFNWLKRCTP